MVAEILSCARINSSKNKNMQTMHVSVDQKRSGECKARCLGICCHQAKIVYSSFKPLIYATETDPATPDCQFIILIMMRRLHQVVSVVGSHRGGSCVGEAKQSCDSRRSLADYVRIADLVCLDHTVVQASCERSSLPEHSLGQHV